MKIKHLLLKLLFILGSLFYLLLIAALAGVLGFITSMSLVILASLYLANKFNYAAMVSLSNINTHLILVFIIILGVLRGLLRYLEQYFNHLLAFKILFKLRLKLFRILNKLAPTKIDEMPKGKLVSLVTADIETLEVFYAHTISPLIISITITTLASLFLFFVCGWQWMVILLSSHLLIMFYPLLIGKSMRNDGQRYRHHLAQFNAFFLDNIKGLKEISLNNLSAKQAPKINKYSKRLVNASNNINDKASYSGGFINYFISLVVIVAIMLGAFLYRDKPGAILIGVISILATFGAVLAVGLLPINLTQTFASAKRMFKLINTSPTVSPIINKNDFTFHELMVNNLTFKYQSRPILKNVSFHVKKGEIIGLIGTSGSGKSTIVKQLLRAYPVANNTIFYNGIDINEINTTSLYQNIAYLSQDTFLFRNTIKNNLTLFNDEIKDDAIFDALAEAAILSHIKNLPNQLDSDIKALATNLSSGEKQRLGLARVFLKKAPLIILDEATSNIDSLNEGIILRALKQKCPQAAIIIITHRQSTMAICDRVYKLNQGVLQEEKNKGSLKKLGV